MATRELLFHLTNESQASLPAEAVWAALGFVALAYYLVMRAVSQRPQDLPFINFDKSSEWTHTRAKHEFVKNAKDLVSSGFRKVCRLGAGQ